jgi:toxin ParE1/3/4
MKRYSYWISPAAAQDLEEIYNYTALEWSESQADKYYFELIEGIAFLANNPFSGKTADYIREGYRIFHIQSHFIYYLISADNIVQVVRILHQNMDAAEQFR